VSEWRVECGDCLEVMATLADGSVDMIVTDPPYFKVKGEAWDRQWARPEQFLAWLDLVLVQFRRVLKPNGSLYLFASPRMAYSVEGLVRQRFNVLNSIRWVKEGGWHKKSKKEELRAYLTPWEACIFAEQYASEYEDAARALHKEVFAPLGRYLQQERERAGLTRNDVEVALGYVSSNDPTRGTALCYRWEEGSSLPTARDYERLREVLNRDGSEYLRREYEELRREYEELRRPFGAIAEGVWSDIWHFSPVTPESDKHSCEKPVAMLEHIIATSSRPGALVLDAFAGSGATGEAALRLGRSCILVEKSRHWAERCVARLEGYERGTASAAVCVTAEGSFAKQLSLLDERAA
jgi:adenine-specific DNA-methyltransferase